MPESASQGARRPADSTSPSASPRQLRQNSISLPGATAMGIAYVAPAAGMAFIPPIVASHAGAAVPFIYLLALAGALCVGYTISQFARAISSAGSYYAFNAAGLGPSAGFVSGWLLLVGYLIGFPQNMLAFGNSFSDVLVRYTGTEVPWWLFTIGGTVLIALIALAGLGLSVRVDIAMIIVEVVVLLVLAVVIVAKGGDSGNTATVLTPAAAGEHSSTMLFGLVFGFLTFIGFESAATAAEETRDAQRNIPRAILSSVAISGVFFTFITYAVTIGFGPGNADALAADENPLSTLAVRYIGPSYTILVDLAVVFSAFAVAIAAANGLTRVMFAMARDRTLPPVLARIHPTLRTPYVAILLVAAVSMGASLGLGGAVGPYPEAYSYLGAFGGLPVVLLYGLVGVSLPLYMWRHRRSGFHLVRHLLIPALGIVLTGMAIYGSYSPFPEGAFLWINFGFLTYLALGIGLSVYLHKRRPELMAKVGKVSAE